MRAVKGFLGRLREGSLQERDCLVALAAGFILFVALYSGAFRSGYYAEDFTWLLWTRDASFLDVWSPLGGTYFRPLSVRLPYWLFPRLPFGHFLWKLTAFGLIGGSSLFLWRWLDLLTGRRAIALLLALAWMHSPFQAFPLYYVNALDYAAFPFVLLGFLLAVERNQWGASFAWLWAGLLVKEWAVAFPALAFLWKRVPPRVLLAFALSIPPFAWWSGLFTAGGSLAGFSFHIDPVRVASSLSFFFSRAFLPGFVIHPFYSWGWFLGAALLLSVGAIGLLYSYRGLQAFRLMALGSCLFLPLFFFSNVKGEYLGAVLWIFLFAISSLGLGALTLSVPRRVRLAYLAVVGGLFIGYLPAERVEAVRRFAFLAYMFDFTLHNTEIFAGKCVGTPVAWMGWESLDMGQESAEHLLWGLRWKFPGTEFFMVKNPGFEESRVIPPHRVFWIDRSVALGNPKMLVLQARKSSAGFDVVSLKGGTPGCGVRLGSVPDAR